LLEYFKHVEVLDDVLQFDKNNTEKSHFTMAWMQALKGRNKLLFKKQRKKSSVNNRILKAALAS